MRIYYIVFFCFVGLAVQAMQQKPPAAQTSTDALSQKKPLILAGPPESVANELFERDMTIQRADLSEFSVDIQKKLWARIEELKKMFDGCFSAKNGLDATVGLEFEFTSPRKLRSSKKNLRLDVQHGEVHLLPVKAGFRYEPSYQVILRVICAPSDPIKSRPFFVDSKHGCFVNITQRDSINMTLRPGRSVKVCSYGIERKVVLRNSLNQAVRIRVKDLTTDAYIVDQIVQPSGIVSCVAFLPFSQLDNSENYPLGVHVWALAGATQKLRDIGARTAITIGDLMPLNGFASHFDINAFMHRADDSYGIIKSKR